ncbi:MAG: SLC13 family permease, partial [Lachnospiraceae bacterium]
MTFEMILALSILVFMIVLIMTDKMAFGAPPLLACLLLVLTGLSTVQEAFAGFVNPNIVMITGFMIVIAGLQKTSLIGKVKSTMLSLVEIGGYKSYVLLIIVVMIGVTLVGSGSTGYYVLILSMVATIPYNKKLPPSKLMLPLGFATYHPLVPINVALHYGVMITVLESAGFMDGVSMFQFSLMNAFVTVAFLLWSLIAYRFLPDHPIAEATEEQIAVQAQADIALPLWKERATIIAFAVSVICMMLMKSMGNIAYVVPGFAGAFLLIIGVLDFKEVRNNMTSPVIIMMAGVIGVANALNETGFTTMVGETVATSLGTSVSPFILILAFALLTSTCATFTGSNMGSVFIFAPIAIATCVSLGISPVAAAAAITVSGWMGGYMPIDGKPAMIFALGNYKLTSFWA